MALKTTVLKGLVLDKVEEYGDRIIFITNEGREFELDYKESSGNVMEDVEISSINGKIDNIIGEEIINVKYSDNEEENEYGEIIVNICCLFETKKGKVEFLWEGELLESFGDELDFNEIVH